MKSILVLLFVLFSSQVLSSELNIKCYDNTSNRDLTFKVTDVSREKSFGNCYDKIVISDRFIANLSQYILKSNSRICIYKRSSDMLYNCILD
jgi:hypothetical protein